MTREEYAKRLRAFDERKTADGESFAAIREQINALAAKLPPGAIIVETGPEGSIDKLIDQLEQTLATKLLDYIKRNAATDALADALTDYVAPKGMVN